MGSVFYYVFSLLKCAAVADFSIFGIMWVLKYFFVLVFKFSLFDNMYFVEVFTTDLVNFFWNYLPYIRE